MNSNFEERLLSALKEEITTRTSEENIAVQTPVRRGPNRRLLGLSAVVAGAAAAVTVAFTLFGGAGTPAYAVDKGADGSVGVQINEFRDPDELEAKLGAAGIKAVVDYLPAGQTCQQSRGEHAATGGQMQIGVGRDGKGIAFTIGKGQIGSDQTLVLAISIDRAGVDKPPVATSLQVVKGSVAPCETTALPIPTDPSTNDGKHDKGTGPTDNTDNSGKNEGPSNNTGNGGKDEGPSLNTVTG
ncbi:hypothetical protein FHR32_002787 [Streptosporangium album]|uniref:Uncharacterized protein n=1 Tax=Streptosporangium album TaxID=47479 RepID=A0A7W7RV34_9ACTN|nr:hypothetical protein [Streptosporangium album]MBB4938482.1 hypothetical protein [Streptosporangium album]